MQDIIYTNELVYVEIHQAQIPWLKIFTQQDYKEFSECDVSTRLELLRVLDIIEVQMINAFSPTKINIASFGNYLPKVHFHVMARFENDDYFPESMWGIKQREGEFGLTQDEIGNFYTKLPSLL
ncbi:MAG: HIT family protein [Arcobacteraceae bacterium]|nr:HIT family protein [Arcobacteraceae bacterium]